MAFTDDMVEYLEVDVKDKKFVEGIDVKDVADKIISDGHVYIDPDIRVKYLVVYPFVTKTTAGKTVLANNELKVLGNCDYVIEISGELWDVLNEIDREFIVLHYLKKIQVTYDEKSKEPKLGLRKYDIETYREVYERYGVEQFDRIRAQAASVYELEPAQQDIYKVS